MYARCFCESVGITRSIRNVIRKPEFSGGMLQTSYPPVRHYAHHFGSFGSADFLRHVRAHRIPPNDAAAGEVPECNPVEIVWQFAGHN